MNTPLRIDIVSDTVCPWCYVGKRHLEAALAQRADVAVECHWQPFQLNPEMPLEGVDRKTHWRDKFGGDARIEEMTGRLLEVGKTLGLTFDFDAIQRQPSTLKSHVLLHWLDEDWQTQNQLKEAILKAFFVDGLDIGDDDVLVDLALTCDLVQEDVRAALADEDMMDQVRQLDKLAREIGVNGVPTFIFNRKSALVGAQPVEAIVHAIDQTLKDESKTQPS